ncbi:CDGSH iron-sulfur domain-containing protein 2 isoform X2 [Nannospalax galili]|uniref:CDGSH iron-sulfur domain-containing protein 2 isoform X2 n=1 Tax=Nannospalax galili TaxID=1026970 RepID=UPI00111C0327|nr:CDGSH iron-sulfur domain-containing protein 2 isoform X2 [Nannospalax galili]
MHVTLRAPIAARPSLSPPPRPLPRRRARDLPPGLRLSRRRGSRRAVGDAGAELTGRQDGLGERGPHREGAAARLPQAAAGPGEHYRLRSPHRNVSEDNQIAQDDYRKLFSIEA